MTNWQHLLKSSAPAIVNQFVEAIRGLAVAQNPSTGGLIISSSVMRPATFQGCDHAFINECAALPALCCRAQRITRAGMVGNSHRLAADTILLRISCIAPGGRNWRNSLPVVIQPFFSTRRVSAD